MSRPEPLLVGQEPHFARGQLRADEDRLGISRSERRQPAQAGRELQTDLRRLQLGVDAQPRRELGGVQLRARFGLDRVGEFGDARRLERHARRVLVPAEPGQVPRAARERVVEVKAFDAAARSL